MCGISAYVQHVSGAELSERQDSHYAAEVQLETSLNIVAHRGPDARGRWFSEDHRVGLGHVRLSIIDLSSSGNQPFHDQSDRIHAVVNGELYDHEYYRSKLADEFQFVGGSDCEIVIALYKHYGLNFLRHLRGEFAFVLWDEDSQLLLAARDRYGIKSLYYTIVGGKLLVATEIKCFMAFGLQLEWHVPILRDQSWRVGSQTFFKGVHQILPGHYLECRLNEREVQKPYWDLEYPNKFTVDNRSEEEMVQGVRDRLLEAVRLRLRADVPVAIYLSGGIDSSAVAGMVVDLIKQGTQLGKTKDSSSPNVKCFTVQFDEESGQDESAIAQRTADWLGVDLQPVQVDEETLAARFEETVWHSEVALPDLNGVCRLALSEAVHARGIKVVITGEGSDEHFGGYPIFQVDSLTEADHAWPALMMSDPDREEALSAAKANSMYRIFGGDSSNVPAAAKRMLSNTDVMSTFAQIGSLPFAGWTSTGKGFGPETALIQGFDGRVRDAMAERWHPLHTAQYLFTKLSLPYFILRYMGDNIDMVHQVESRCPFLDHHVTEYVNKLPPSLKMRYNPTDKTFREKYILREAVKPYVTDEVYNMGKKPFFGPSKFRPDGPVCRKIKELVTKKNVDALGFLDWAVAENAVKRGFEQQDAASLRIAVAVAQFVVLGQRFRVKTATPGTSKRQISVPHKTPSWFSPPRRCSEYALPIAAGR